MTAPEPHKDARTPRPRVAAAAARASIAMYERDGRDVPQWLRDVADGKPIDKRTAGA
ncbi:hypothetical protein [Rhodococcoides corynebacterioides]|uniref:Uncharacterized protein n=1 Tax=Rhodococcoides corynebacterioides TaxID=53972 RepID=A0ABS7P364_9NOCA|nr:hypothetical protein [Rhodococcus corynebacterioides]MBY6366859.1 hypothetical protein [Rhodococcus corynebacterioides]MBY6409142.1 hypothetical protein [Rhodococcus corynebacterioides]